MLLNRSACGGKAFIIFASPAGELLWVYLVIISVIAGALHVVVLRMKSCVSFLYCRDFKVHFAWDVFTVKRFNAKTSEGESNKIAIIAVAQQHFVKQFKGFCLVEDCHSFWDFRRARISEEFSVWNRTMSMTIITAICAARQWTAPNVGGNHLHEAKSCDTRELSFSKHHERFVGECFSENNQFFCPILFVFAN